MNNTVRTIIVIYIVVFAVICLFFIPCKQFSYVDTKAIFTGVRDIFSVRVIPNKTDNSELSVFLLYWLASIMDRVVTINHYNNRFSYCI